MVMVFLQWILIVKMILFGVSEAYQEFFPGKTDESQLHAIHHEYYSLLLPSHALSERIQTTQSFANLQCPFERVCRENPSSPFSEMKKLQRQEVEEDVKYVEVVERE